MDRMHYHPVAGHLGIAKNIARAAEIYYWSRMFADIAKYVHECTNCLTHKASQERPACSMRYRLKLQQVSVDFVSPLPRFTDGHLVVRNAGPIYQMGETQSPPSRHNSRGHTAIV